MQVDLFVQIKDSMPDFSKGHKKIAEFILEHYEKAAYVTAAKLGTTVGVSESTVVRFATELGFSGYPEFQSALQDIIRNKLTSIQRIEATTDRISSDDVFEKILNSDIEKIRKQIFDLLSKIKENGTFILNTEKTAKKRFSAMSERMCNMEEAYGRKYGTFSGKDEGFAGVCGKEKECIGVSGNC